MTVSFAAYYFSGCVIFVCALFLVGVESGRPVSAQFQDFVLFSGVITK